MTHQQMITNFTIIFITFVFAAFFVAAEFALVQTRVTALQELQEQGNKPRLKVQRAITMVSNLTEYLSTTQVGTSVCGIILGWVGEQTIEELLSDLLKWPALALPNAGVHAISAIVGVLVLTYFEVVLTEIVPKNISIDVPVKMLLFTVTPLHYFHLLFYPFVWLLNTSANGIVRLLGMKPANETDEVLSQGEIISLSRNAVRSGQLGKNDLVYMERAFDFNDKVAKDIMIDRTQLTVIDIQESVGAALDLYISSQYSRLPVVANGDKDKILGYVFNYDLIRQQRVDPTVSLAKVLRHLSTTAESTPITEVLQMMIRTRVPMVVVIDEYGGTSGIITDKDIYEELFGTVRDEIDNVADNLIKKGEHGQFEVDGKTTTYDFERYFHTDIKAFDHSNAVTLAGFIMETTPKVHEGQVINLGEFELTVADYQNAYIDRFIVRRRSDTPSQPTNTPIDPAES
ncbi:hemolysin family protein [Limosilactobacillus gorillae]|uniref:hemolysin family protein n=1 Tax=Limosilactobacillus gorillae TaxID=1450649 RepID=UPI000A82450F|nr:hemolysin family protein [Limosilactobacillus gorillae]